MLNNAEIQAIIDRVHTRLGDAGAAGRPGAAVLAAAELGAEAELGDGIYPTIDAAVSAASGAYDAYSSMGLDRRKSIIESVRRSMTEHGERLAILAATETGIGRAEDKIIKNRLVTEKSPGPEDLEPQVVTGDGGMTVTEFAPLGVVAAITPTTNPTSTIINNTIAIVSAGNAAVFNVHPNAKRVSAENIRLLNRAIQQGGGPPDLVTGIPEPTIDSAKELMHHPGIQLLLVTGGPGVVREAMKTDKRVVAAGPGNPPAVVDQTAEIDRAARDIVAGASFDNNVICTDEKEVIAIDSIADRLIREMGNQGAYILKEHELKKLERMIFREPGAPGKPAPINTQFVGKNAGVILNAAGISVDPGLRLAVADVGNEHSLIWTEQMMPILPVTRVPNIEAAIDLAVRAEHRFRHTASIHSTNVETITRMARAINCSIFVANAPNFAGLGEGGEGYTSFSIASPTGDGLTRARTFTRPRRISVVGALRII